MYTATGYVKEIQPILARYKAENTWFRWWDPDDTTNILNGWRMYQRAAKNALGFLLLGDTAIRTNKALLFNFGLTSAHGVQEQKDIAMIEQIMAQRTGFARPHMKATNLLGPGSILSDKNWSPLLNDSFVLGGVNRCQEFHLADDAFDSFPEPTMAPQSLVAQRRAAFGSAATGYAANAADPVQEKWKAYFCANPKIFFESFGPRVFAREVIGMMTYGYKPIFSPYELGFVCVDQSKALGATFTSYCDALRNVNFSAGAGNRTGIMAAISEYLFGAPDILS